MIAEMHGLERLARVAMAHGAPPSARPRPARRAPVLPAALAALSVLALLALAL